MERQLYEAAASGNIIFLQREPELDQVTPQKNTVLHIAVSFKQLEFSKKVLHLCPLLLLKANSKGESPLHLAATIGCFEIAALLVNVAKELRQNIESQVVDTQMELLRMVNQEMDMALHVAVKNGHLAIVKLLLETDSGLLEFVNSVNASPLYLAVDGKFSSIAHCILNFSPEAHFGGPKGMTALHSAVIRAQHDIVEVLLEKRQEMIKEVDIHGRIPLHYAAHGGYLKTTRLLLKCDSSTAYLLDKDGTSALHVAAYNGHIHIVESLIQCCPDIAELIDNKGRTALHVAILNRQEKMVRYILKMPKLVRIINEKDEDGNTALHLAVIHKRVSIIKYLVCDRRVEKTALNKEFSTAYDIFRSQREMPSYSVAKTYYFLRGTWGLPYFQQLYESKEEKEIMEEAKVRVKSVLGAVRETSDETTRSMLEIHLLVAMLIATVTFTAAFSVPGGYEENGDDKGIATFVGKAFFKAFVISNTIAFCLSIATVFIHVGTSHFSYRARTRFTIIALKFLHIALYGMVIAFASGVYLVLAKCIGLAISLNIMTLSCLLVYILLWFFDPAGTYFPGLSKARKYLRTSLFRYGII